MTDDELKSLKVKRYCMNVERTMICPLLRAGKCLIQYTVTQEEKGCNVSQDCKLESITLNKEFQLTVVNKDETFIPLKAFY
jgi:hypothetical protein